MKTTLSILPVTLALMLTLSACNEPEFENTPPPTEEQPSSSSSSSSCSLPETVEPTAEELENAAIQSVVDDENQYREVVGQVPLAKGLHCTLYTVPVSQPTIVGATLTTKATWALNLEINQPDAPSDRGVNIIPPSIRSQYRDWYKVTCTGYLAIVDSQYLELQVRSDDNSILTLDGTKIIVADQHQGPTTRVGSKLLRKGLRSIKLEYMQGPGGSMALQLMHDGTPIPSKYFFR